MSVAAVHTSDKPTTLRHLQACNVGTRSSEASPFRAPSPALLPLSLLLLVSLSLSLCRCALDLAPSRSRPHSSITRPRVGSVVAQQKSQHSGRRCWMQPRDGGELNAPATHKQPAAYMCSGHDKPLCSSHFCSVSSENVGLAKIVAYQFVSCFAFERVVSLTIVHKLFCRELPLDQVPFLDRICMTMKRLQIVVRRHCSLKVPLSDAAAQDRTQLQFHFAACICVTLGLYNCPPYSPILAAQLARA